MHIVDRVSTIWPGGLEASRTSHLSTASRPPVPSLSLNGLAVLVLNGLAVLDTNGLAVLVLNGLAVYI